MTAALVERDRVRAGSRSRGRSAPNPRRAQGRPKLKVLNQQAARQRSRRRHALLALFIVVLLGFFAVAFVHAELVADQQQLDGIRNQIAEAEARNARMSRAVEEASSPEAIVSHATEELGMVRAVQPVYLAVAAPVRDVPTAISFRTSRSATVEGTVGDDGPVLAVGISAVARVKQAIDQDPGSGPVELATPVATPQTQIQTQAQTQTQPRIQTGAAVVGQDDGAGQSGFSGRSVVVGSTATPAADPGSDRRPAPSAVAGVGVEPDMEQSRAPSSIAGTRAVVGGASASTTQTATANTATADSTNTFGGMSAGTGNG